MKKNDENAMRMGSFILWILAACLMMGASRAVCAESTAAQEYQLKAAFLYNFILFVDGERFEPPTPEAKKNDPNQPILVGILGKDPFGNAFEPLQNKLVRDRRVVIRRFKSLREFADAEGRLPGRHPQFERIQDCHVLFICQSEAECLAHLLRPAGRWSVLTVADTPGFLEAGGIINFLIEDKKVRFEVNTAAAQRANLRIRSQLLRLAKRIVRTDALEKPNDEGTNGDT